MEDEEILAKLEGWLELGLRVVRCYQALEHEQVGSPGDSADLLEEGEVPIDQEEGEMLGEQRSHTHYCVTCKKTYQCQDAPCSNPTLQVYECPECYKARKEKRERGEYTYGPIGRWKGY